MLVICYDILVKYNFAKLRGTIKNAYVIVVSNVILKLVH